MEIVWLAFSVTAVILAVAALVASRARQRSSAFRVVGWSLLTMAVGTAAFPALLPVLGVVLWASAYVAFVLIVTGFLTAYTAMGGHCRDERRTS